MKIGDKVKVYRMMNPRRDFKRISTILDIGPMHGGGETMLWLDSISGAWHPDACEVCDPRDESPKDDL
jgi:hypothetical protein